MLNQQVLAQHDRIAQDTKELTQKELDRVYESLKVDSQRIDSLEMNWRRADAMRNKIK